MELHFLPGLGVYEFRGLENEDADSMLRFLVQFDKLRGRGQYDLVIREPGAAKKACHLFDIGHDKLVRSVVTQELGCFIVLGECPLSLRIVEALF